MAAERTGHQPARGSQRDRAGRGVPPTSSLSNRQTGSPGLYDRCRPGMNHLAFHVASREEVDKLVDAGAPARVAAAFQRPPLHPHAGGLDHYAAYLEDRDGYEVELVAPSAL